MLYLDFSSFFHSCLFPLPGSHLGYPIAFSRYPSLVSSGLWQFLGLFLFFMTCEFRDFVECPSTWVCLMFSSWFDTGSRFLRILRTWSALLIPPCQGTWYWCHPSWGKSTAFVSSYVPGSLSFLIFTPNSPLSALWPPSSYSGRRMIPFLSWT